MKKRNIFFLLLTFILVLIAVAEAGVLFVMVNTIIHKESPRQIQKYGPIVPLDLSGEWIQSDPEDGNHVLRIADGSIEIYLNNEDGYSLFWAGSFDPPVNAREPYRWKSKNDTERTSQSPSGSEEKSIKFTYRDGVLSYKADGSAVEAVRGSWGYENVSNVGPQSSSRFAESGDLGDYHIEIGGAQLSSDVSGEPAVIVTYSWTNNSEAAASAMVMLIERAFQNGVQLTSAQVPDDANYNADSVSITVEPGSSQIIQRAFLLDDPNANLSFEVSEFLSQSNEAVAKDFDLSALS